MNLLMITELDPAGAALAEKLSETNHVTVLHPRPWALESSFAEKQCPAHRLLTHDLSGYGAVICVASHGLEIRYLECLLERLRQWPGLRCICVEAREACEREGMPVSAAEALCAQYRQRWELNATYLSVPALYGADFLPQGMMRSLLRRPGSNRIELQGSPEDPCDMLHVNDLTALLTCMADKEADCGAAAVIGSGHAAQLGEAAETIRAHFRLTELTLTAQDAPARPARTGSFPGWMPRHSFMHELPEVLTGVEEQGFRSLRSRRGARLRLLGRIGLFLLLFACTCLYTGFIKVSSELQFVDVRLLFVVGVSLYMGRSFGLAAGVFASVASIVEAVAAGNRWYVLFFHIDNWIPMAVYLAAAVLLGMYSENHRPKEDGENE